MTTEEPTMEFRQVRHKANLWNGDWYVFFMTQQKWIIHEEVNPSFPHGGKIGRDEWRDIPIVDVKEAK
jgi:hypothetical protein